MQALETYQHRFYVSNSAFAFNTQILVKSDDANIAQQKSQSTVLWTS